MMRTQDVCRAAATVFAIGVATLGMAGCGSSDQTAQAGGSSTSAAAASSNASPQTSAPKAATHPIDVCAALPAATAAKLSGKAVTIANAIPGLQGQGYGCGYTNEADDVQFEVTVFEHDAASTYDLFLSGTKGASVVSGVGDKAFFDNDSTMYVLKGSYLLQVNNVKTADQCAAVARPVIAAM